MLLRALRYGSERRVPSSSSSCASASLSLCSALRMASLFSSPSRQRDNRRHCSGRRAVGAAPSLPARGSSHARAGAACETIDGRRKAACLCVRACVRACVRECARVPLPLTSISANATRACSPWRLPKTPAPPDGRRTCNVQHTSCNIQHATGARLWCCRRHLSQLCLWSRETATAFLNRLWLVLQRCRCAPIGSAAIWHARGAHS